MFQVSYNQQCVAAQTLNEIFSDFKFMWRETNDSIECESPLKLQSNCCNFGNVFSSINAVARDTEWFTFNSTNDTQSANNSLLEPLKVQQMIFSFCKFLNSLNLVIQFSGIKKSSRWSDCKVQYSTTGANISLDLSSFTLLICKWRITDQKFYKIRAARFIFCLLNALRSHVLCSLLNARPAISLSRQLVSATEHKSRTLKHFMDNISRMQSSFRSSSIVRSWCLSLATTTSTLRPAITWQSTPNALAADLARVSLTKPYNCFVSLQIRMPFTYSYEYFSLFWICTVLTSPNTEKWSTISSCLNCKTGRRTESFEWQKTRKCRTYLHWQCSDVQSWNATPILRTVPKLLDPLGLDMVQNFQICLPRVKYRKWFAWLVAFLAFEWIYLQVTPAMSTNLNMLY